MKRVNVEQMRNLIFGAEDSVVSTMGVLFGTATTDDYSARQITIVGLILIVVEALSMGVGSYLSETSALERRKNSQMNPVIDGIVMFVSYFLTGIFIVAPYHFFPISTAKYVSVVVGIFLLLLLGYLPAKNPKSALRMVVMASLALVVSYLVGKYLDANLA